MLNFEIAEHLVYDGLELQWYDDAAHQWRASIGPQGETTTGWRRTSAAGADDYRRATGT